MGSVSAVMMMNSQIPRLRVYLSGGGRNVGSGRACCGRICSETHLGSLVGTLLELLVVRSLLNQVQNLFPSGGHERNSSSAPEHVTVSFSKCL